MKKDPVAKDKTKLKSTEKQIEKKNEKQAKQKEHMFA